MLKPAMEIIADSWHLYLHNWRKLLPFLILRFIPHIVLSSLGILFLYLTAYLPSFSLAGNLIILVIFVASIVLNVWTKIALIRATYDNYLGQTIPWKATFSNTSALIGPAILSTILWFLIILGGSILLIIPGIIFAVWYNFYLYAVVLENATGMNALRISRGVVSGRWWHMAWRILATTFVFGFLTFIISAILVNLISLIPMPTFIESTVTSLTASLIAVCTLPFFLGSNLILYFNAKQNAVMPVMPNVPPRT